jgi:diguanylate cyclase (GGDEF)-like protein
MSVPGEPEELLVDQLTGLSNRRQLERILPPILERRNASRKALSILLFDINQLEELNELHGQRVGDQTVVRTAELLRSNVKAGDPMARWARDEFIIVLEDEGRNIAEKVAQRLVERVAGEPFEISGKTLNVTVSAGVATFPEDGTDLETLLQSAERILQARKRV